MNEQDKALHLFIVQTCVAVSKRLSRAIDYLEIGVQEGLGINDVLTLNCVRLAVGVDTWGSTYGGSGRKSPDHVVALLGDKLKNAILLTGNSFDVVLGMRHPFDVILVDGDHSQLGCLNDLNACAQRLGRSGVILVDDLRHPAHSYLEAAAMAWALTNKYEYEFHNIGHGIAELSKQ